jgi:hypothetical protein
MIGKYIRKATESLKKYILFYIIFIRFVYMYIAYNQLYTYTKS